MNFCKIKEENKCLKIRYSMKKIMSELYSEKILIEQEN